jgi:hypothetical protein
MPYNYTVLNNYKIVKITSISICITVVYIISQYFFLLQIPLLLLHNNTNVRGKLFRKSVQTQFNTLVYLSNYDPMIST